MVWHLADARPAADLPPPPAPEPIAIEELPLPPTAPAADTGACTVAVNPHKTGCMSASDVEFQAGSFLPDGKHVVTALTFAGAPSATDPSAIYSGPQLVLIKTDHTTFSNGDSWKCL